MTDCTQVPTLDEIYQAKKNITDLDTFANSTADTFVDSDGITKTTLTGYLKLFGFGVAPFTFMTGGVLQSRNILVSNDPIDSFLYEYIGSGTFPLTIVPVTDPTIGGDWQPIATTSHAALSYRNPADGSAHNTDDILSLIHI